MALYADYHPQTSLKGFGFANRKKALHTISLLEKMGGEVKKKVAANPNYKIQVVLTMYYRAKHHPHRTADMEKAMKVFKKYLDSHRIKVNIRNKGKQTLKKQRSKKQRSKKDRSNK